MSDEACRDELLSLWQAETARGRSLAVTVLCREAVVCGRSCTATGR